MSNCHWLKYIDLANLIYGNLFSFTDRTSFCMSAGELGFDTVNSGSYSFGSFSIGSYDFGSFSIGSYGFGSFSIGSYSFGSFAFGSYDFGAFEFGAVGDCNCDYGIPDLRELLAALRYEPLNLFGYGIDLI